MNESFPFEITLIITLLVSFVEDYTESSKILLFLTEAVLL